MDNNRPSVAGHCASDLRRGRALGLGFALLACAATTVLGLGLRHWLDGPNIVMMFLLNVVLVARYLGQSAATLSAVLCVAAFDFFFVPPHLSFAVADLQYLLTFGVMLFVSLLIGHLTIGLRRSALLAEDKAAQTAELFALASTLGRALTREDVARAITVVQRALPDITCRLYALDDHEHLQPEGAAGALSDLEAMAAGHVMRDNKLMLTADLTADAHPLMILPLWGSTRMRGVLMADMATGSADLMRHRAMLEAIAALFAASLERLHFVAVAQQLQMEAAAERLRNSILAAVSHDIRTPLTALFGTADALMLDAAQAPEALRENIFAIHEQSMRLNGLVGNLLELARLHTGNFQLRKEWQPLEEVVGSSLKLLDAALARHRIELHLPRDLPLLEFDAVLLERVLCNLIDNAIRHAPPGSAIAITAALEKDHVEICVGNEGARIPEAQLTQLFEMFSPDTHAKPHSGLGLSICKTIMTAHAGSISARNQANGVRICVALPLGTPPELPRDPEDPPGAEAGPAV